MTGRLPELGAGVRGTKMSVRTPWSPIFLQVAWMMSKPSSFASEGIAIRNSARLQSRAYGDWYNLRTLPRPNQRQYHHSPRLQHYMYPCAITHWQPPSNHRAATRTFLDASGPSPTEAASPWWSLTSSYSEATAPDAPMWRRGFRMSKCRMASSKVSVWGSTGSRDRSLVR